MLRHEKLTILKGMGMREIEDWCQSFDQPPYRGKQIFEWMYSQGIVDPFKMSNLPCDFQQNLQENCILDTLHIEKITSSELEETNKFLFKTLDDHYIETVSMVEDNRHTVCISSQIGCNLDCDFCATAKMGIIRNLSQGEMVDQLLHIRHHIDAKITNVVFMGMGEPFMNYERVLNTADIYHHQKGFGLGARRITISTAGVLPKIVQYIKEQRKYKLAISLNASNDIARTQIMPINKQFNIKALVDAAKEYAKVKRRNVLFEYVLLSGINDSADDAYELSQLLKGVDCKLNIIPYNEIDCAHKRPSDEVITTFLKILSTHQDGFRVLVRWSKGQDINAGCGQLAVKHLSNE